MEGGGMKRLLALLATLSVAVLGFAGSAFAAVVTPTVIEEPFVGTSIDYTHVWAWWGTNQPDHVRFYQANGVMNIDVSATAQPDFDVGNATRCMARGDFDARVSFNLVDWPPENGVWVSLMVNGGPFNVYRVSWQFPDHEQYGVYLPPSGNTVSATGTTGTIRLTRKGSTFTGYYLAGDGTWVPIGSGIGPTDDASFTLGVFNISAAATFAGLPVTVTLDNFRVIADQIVCP
jgi:hypothetical protein